jgi:hypothetical protein
LYELPASANTIKRCDELDLDLAVVAFPPAQFALGASELERKGCTRMTVSETGRRGNAFALACLEKN